MGSSLILTWHPKSDRWSPTILRSWQLPLPRPQFRRSNGRPRRTYSPNSYRRANQAFLRRRLPSWWISHSDREVVEHYGCDFELFATYSTCWFGPSSVSLDLLTFDPQIYIWLNIHIFVTQICIPFVQPTTRLRPTDCGDRDHLDCQFQYQPVCERGWVRKPYWWNVHVGWTWS